MVELGLRKGARSSLITACRRPVSTCVRRIHLRSFPALQPIFSLAATPTLNALSVVGDDCVPTCPEVQLDSTSKVRLRSQNLPPCYDPCVSNAKVQAAPLSDCPTRRNFCQIRTPPPGLRQESPRLFFVSAPTRFLSANSVAG